ncbi:MAG: threonine/serine exporter family protein [bacterium]|nr:threonine/serine exporter family protein [bacterium]
MIDPGQQDTAAFLMRLATALHAYGTPSHRLEEALELMSADLEIEAQYLVAPTSIIGSIGPERRQETYLVRVEPGETNLDKLTSLNEVMRRVEGGELDVRRGVKEVDRVVSGASRYRPEVTALAYAVTSGSAAILFGGGWREAVLSLGLGGLLGLLAIFAIERPRLAALYPALASLLAASIASGVASLASPVSSFIATLAGIIVLIPGLSLTIAMNELAHRHLVSGTARLTGALITFLQIGLGGATGWAITEALFGKQAPSEPLALPAEAFLLAAPLAAASFTVLFRARPVDYGWILLGCSVAFLTARFGGDAFGPEIGAALGAWVLGCLSNLLARWRGKPSSITLVPGLLILVPGSFGFRSLQALVQDNVLAGVETGFSMALIAMSLVTGLFLSNLTVAPRRLL